MDYNYDDLPPVIHKGVEHPLPLSDESRAYFMARGKDVLVRNADDKVKQHEARQRMLAEAEEEPFVVDEEDDYSKWSTDDLKAELAERELPTNGNKKQLVARLEEDDEKAAQEAAAENGGTTPTE